MYDLALFLHIVGVVLLVGAVTTTLLATLRAQRAATVAEIASLTAVTRKIDLVIGPAMLLILGPALYMVSRGGDDGGIHWTSGWVDVALVVFLVMAVLGPTVESAHAKRLQRRATQLPDGPVPPELDAARRAPAGTYVTFFGVSQIVAFLYLMTNKPALAGSVAACVGAGLVSALVAAARLRSLEKDRDPLKQASPGGRQPSAR
jgi:uncharacterized membrane protein